MVMGTARKTSLEELTHEKVSSIVWDRGRDATGQAKKAAAAIDKFLIGALKEEPHVPTDPNYSAKDWKATYLKAVS